MNQNTFQQSGHSRQSAPALSSKLSMQQLQQLANDVLQSFQQDKLDITTTIDCLERERKAFEQNDQQTVNDLATQKSVLIQSLDDRNHQRCQKLNAAGYDSNPDQWKNTLIALENASSIQLLASWKELEQGLAECQRLLLINERILQGIQHSVGRFLNILRGQTGSGQTYDAAGKAQLHSDYRPITKA